MKRFSPATDSDDDIASAPAAVQPLRAKVRKRSPEACQVIRNRTPAVKQHGKLVSVATWMYHIGLSPPRTGDKALAKAAPRSAGPKGDLRFPLDPPIPYALIARIVKLRAKQDSDNAARR